MCKVDSRTCLVELITNELLDRVLVQLIVGTLDRRSGTLRRTQATMTRIELIAGFRQDEPCAVTPVDLRCTVRTYALLFLFLAFFVNSLLQL